MIYDMSNVEQIQLFGDKQIRTAWDDAEEKWYFSITDIIFALVETDRPRKYKKIEANRERDLRDYTFLEAQGWKVIVVWKCELSKAKLLDTVGQIQSHLELNRKNWLDEKADRKKRREE